MAEVNGREHRVTRRAPAEMLVEEQQRLHALPETPYTVVSGDFLDAVARRFGVSLRALIAANGITDPTLIFVGQVLVIPGVEPRARTGA